jgi:hypothetical protein
METKIWKDMINVSNSRKIMLFPHLNIVVLMGEMNENHDKPCDLP